MSNLNKGTAEYIQYSECTDFIIEEMNFYSYEDFIKRAKNLKVLFTSSNNLIKKLYLWYVYSRYITLEKKNMIWSYLNNSLSFSNLTKK